MVEQQVLDREIQLANFQLTSIYVAKNYVYVINYGMHFSLSLTLTMDMFYLSIFYFISTINKVNVNSWFSMYKHELDFLIIFLSIFSWNQ